MGLRRKGLASVCERSIGSAFAQVRIVNVGEFSQASPRYYFGPKVRDALASACLSSKRFLRPWGVELSTPVAIFFSQTSDTSSCRTSPPMTASTSASSSASSFQT